MKFFLGNKFLSIFAPFILFCTGVIFIFFVSESDQVYRGAPLKTDNDVHFVANDTVIHPMPTTTTPDNPLPYLIPADTWQTFVYGGDPLQTYDVRRPKTAVGRAPLVIIFHGGSSDTGDKSRMRERALEFFAKGAVVITPNYRYDGPVAGVSRYDVACAIVTARSLATTKWGANPDHTIVVGFSFGSFLTSFDLFFPEKTRMLDECAIKDVSLLMPALYIAEAGQFGSPSDSNPYKRLDDVASTVGAIRYVDIVDPPTILIHGKKDTTHAYQRSVDFYEALQSAGVWSRLKITGGSHNSGLQDDPVIQKWMFDQIEELNPDIF